MAADQKTQAREPDRLAQHPLTQERLAQERHQQLIAALLLGLAALLVIVLRAGVGRIFLPGWWRIF